MRTFILNSVFIFSILCIASTPSWAISVNTDIEILNRGPGSGFNYSLIHSANCSSALCMSGSYLYGKDLSGTLNGDLDLTTAPTLSNIRGVLTAPQGGIEFTGGFLHAVDDGGLTSGQLDYTFLSGKLKGESGTFFFLARQLCCSSAPYGGPNHLTPNGFTLWGNNWDITADGGLNSREAVLNAGLTPLGIDLVGGNYSTPTTATPEPTSMLLLGSGMAGLLYWRKKKAKAVE
ncbi:MAG: PEP-CTERM sorting domain-containing protein [Nitrospirales bacterium]